MPVVFLNLSVMHNLENGGRNMYKYKYKYKYKYPYHDPKAQIQKTDIRKINPPKLDSAHLGQKILCFRPTREGSPNMSVESRGKQIIANNYGHGGSGWTLGPGAVRYVIDLLAAKMREKNMLKKDIPITIIGAGAIGLFSALELYERGYRNLTIVAKAFENLTSHRAGGLLAPVSMSNAPEVQPLIDKIGIEAYKFYKAIAEKKNPILKEGAVILPAYFQDREHSGLEPYVGKVMQPAKDVILDFKNGTRREVVAYDDGIFIDAPFMMKSLHKALEGKVFLIKKKIQDLQETKTPIIVNATGLGAKELVHDQNMVSVEGHLIMLEDQNPEDINYMILIYYPKGKTKSGMEIERAYYLFPKQTPGAPARDIGVVGGTFIPNAGPKNPNWEEFDLMIKRAKKFYGL
jgi:D-amino-acid oxidase